jgi:ArsR family transcriptional regulator
METAAVSMLKAELFRALGHPMRVRVLERLADSELNVGELQRLLVIDAGGVSAHLSILRRQGLVESRRDGTSVFYRLRDPRVRQLLELTRTMITAQLHNTQMVLRDLDEAVAEPRLGPATPTP